MENKQTEPSTAEAETRPARGATTEPPAPERPAAAAADGAAGEEKVGDGDRWPSSWVMVAAILGIIAIIVVARLLGNSWRAEQVQPPPPPLPPSSPHGGGPGPSPAGHRPGHHRLVLDVADLSVSPGGKHCVGTDAKAHPVTKGAKVPAPCVLDVEGAVNFRLEVVRQQSETEIPLWVFPLQKDPPVLVHTTLPPQPGDQRPLWVAGSFFLPYKAVVVVLENVGKKPYKLERVRFMERGD